MSGEVAFGCAISDSCTCHGKARQHGSIVAAGRAGSGKILVDLAPFYGPPGLLVARMGVALARGQVWSGVLDGVCRIPAF